MGDCDSRDTESLQKVRRSHPCAAQARQHWADVGSYKRWWRIKYLCFNVLLYVSQTILYAAVFFDSWKVDGVRWLYACLATVTFAVPVAHVVLYVIFTFRFVAYPMIPRNVARRAHLSRVLLSWGVGRSLWGAAVLIAVFDPAAADSLRRTHWSGVAIIGLFLITEICPFILALDSGLLKLIDTTNAEDRPRSPAAYSSLARHPRGALPQRHQRP